MRSYWVLRPGAGFVQHLHNSNLLRMACFLQALIRLLRALSLNVIKRNQGAKTLFKKNVMAFVEEKTVAVLYKHNKRGLPYFEYFELEN